MRQVGAAAVAQTARNHRCCLRALDWATECGLLQRCDKPVAHKLMLKLVEITEGGGLQVLVAAAAIIIIIIIIIIMSK